MTCDHVFKSGSRKGQQCSVKPRDGSSYCSKHKNPKNATVPTEEPIENSFEKDEYEFIDIQDDLNHFLHTEYSRIYREMKAIYEMHKKNLTIGEKRKLTKYFNNLVDGIVKDFNRFIFRSNFSISTIVLEQLKKDITQRIDAIEKDKRVFRDKSFRVPPKVTK